MKTPLFQTISELANRVRELAGGPTPQGQEPYRSGMQSYLSTREALLEALNRVDTSQIAQNKIADFLATRSQLNSLGSRYPVWPSEYPELEKQINNLLLCVKSAEQLKETAKIPSLSLFCSYSHKDENHREELGKHLKGLERQGLIRLWHDRLISAGTEWKGQIDENLKTADIFLLLISPDFISSDYCWDLELDYALSRHVENSACVIPIIIRPVSWQDTPLADLQALPKDGKPVTTWTDIDSAWTNVTEGIRRVVFDRLQMDGTLNETEQFPLSSASSDPVAEPLVQTLKNFHVDANVSNKLLLNQAKGYFQEMNASFQEAHEQGRFALGSINSHDQDLNRLHKIVAEIDTRRLFFSCGGDEIPKWAMKSLYEVREKIREDVKGVWANPECEVVIQLIIETLNEFCTKAERMNAGDTSAPEFSFFNLATEMRLKVWLLVAVLKKKTGGLLQPRNLPIELWSYVVTQEV